mmetsp:Transcript_9620/g.10958  ORF Transcript_9620/g.10958 Transcript_9620/m.10958 type:complete len:94 (+) Transcript_9620:51-332(+)|eukprot:CAMPEP_0184035534 /NCGR_PEP_ID=MMETSP0955-20130417/26585_1 /TAXON_ID=627963 /ORGANISM="Aplanochytrium sp, Strain PBS07" /LENGTH=93 /DNA_ID=CAMNT_0026322729 /DNA_START=42 /DNA_END=323 /DNA_ORIENTATION=+
MASSELRLPEFFPLVDKKKYCKVSATKFFDCFSAAGKQEKGVRDAEAGQKGLEQCKKELSKYSYCMNKYRDARSRKLVRAPEAYLEELGKVAN